jgi:arsenical pump membrane protein
MRSVRARVVASLEPLDWLAGSTLLVGSGLVVGQALPASEALRTFLRLLPLLIFLGSVIVLAQLTERAEVFDVLAAWITARAKGNYAVLFGLCVVFATITTLFLNLDTTAVLLTPVMLRTAKKAGMPGAPLAMLTVWLANSASLLLPVSNLTNLLAAGRIDLTPTEFAVRMAVPQTAAIAVTAGSLWLFYWRRSRRGTDRYDPPPPHRPADPVLFWVAAVSTLLFVVLVLAGVPLPAAAVTCTVIVAIPFLVRDRSVFGWWVLPFRLICFLTGLFFVVQTVDRYGLGRLLSGLIGSDGGARGISRAATAGAVLSNAIDNLPAYVAGETAVPVANSDQLLGLLIGTNVGPLVTPWASLAIILWYERCRAADVTVPWRRFAVTGLVTMVTGVAASVAALIWTVRA